MRTDEESFTLDEKTKKESTAFTFDMGRFHTPATRAAMGSSQSGHERDRLFLNDQRARGGEFFADVSGVSGLDSETDGRSFVVLDYDRDGWIDLAEVSANRPMFQLFHNDVDEVLGDAAQGRRFVALRFVGGNTTSQPASGWSSRDAFGTRVELDLGDETLLRTTASSRGLAAQDSATLVVGLGDRPVVARLSVHWPSGRTSTFENLAAGLLYTVHEDAASVEAGTGLEIEPYLPALPPEAAFSAAGSSAAPRIDLLTERGLGSGEGLVLYVGMQTECVACIQELRDVARLADELGDSLRIFGVPVARYGWGPDERRDTREALAAFVERHAPAYELLVDLDEEEVAGYTSWIEAELDQNIYSTTILTDASGRILSTRLGVPTLSEVRRLLHDTRSAAR
ncbi:MAG TPA: hypothetical protein ENJ09_13645 [Planctomycetes bacterium]|nr:hypothetical protein [Planctomycetota bacterium]